MAPIVQRLSRDPRLQRLARRLQMRSRRFDHLSRALPQVICVDVGASHYAHTGWWLFLDSPATTWIAVEPNADSLAYLERWPWRARSVPATIGLSQFGGEQTLYVTNVDTGSSLLQPIVNGAMDDRITGSERDYFFPVTERVVETRSLSDLLENEPARPVFIKLDTQGSELSILKSVVSAGSVIEVVGIEIECSLLASPLYEGSPRLWEVVDHLGPLGFELIGLDVLPRVPGRKISARSRSIPAECDAVFALRRDRMTTSAPESQAALLAFYVTNNLYREASIALQSLPAIGSFLADQACDVPALAAELAKRVTA